MRWEMASCAREACNEEDARARPCVTWGRLRVGLHASCMCETNGSALPHFRPGTLSAMRMPAWRAVPVCSPAGAACCPPSSGALSSRHPLVEQFDQRERQTKLTAIQPNMAQEWKHMFFVQLEREVAVPTLESSQVLEGHEDPLQGVLAKVQVVFRACAQSPKIGWDPASGKHFGMPLVADGVHSHATKPQRTEGHGGESSFPAVYLPLLTLCDPKQCRATCNRAKHSWRLATSKPSHVDLILHGAPVALEHLRGHHPHPGRSHFREKSYMPPCETLCLSEPVQAQRDAKHTKLGEGINLPQAQALHSVCCHVAQRAAACSCLLPLDRVGRIGKQAMKLQRPRPPLVCFHVAGSKLD